MSLLNQAVSDDPKNASAWFMLGHLRQQAGEAEAAARAYERGLTAYPFHPTACEKLAELYREMDRPAEEATAQERWMRVNPHDARPAARLMELYFEQQRWAAEIDDFARCAAVDRCGYVGQVHRKMCASVLGAFGDEGCRA